jgi:hypothetical protein
MEGCEVEYEGGEDIKFYIHKKNKFNNIKFLKV